MAARRSQASVDAIAEHEVVVDEDADEHEREPEHTQPRDLDRVETDESLHLAPFRAGDVELEIPAVRFGQRNDRRGPARRRRGRGVQEMSGNLSRSGARYGNRTRLTQVLKLVMVRDFWS